MGFQIVVHRLSAFWKYETLSQRILNEVVNSYLVYSLFYEPEQFFNLVNFIYVVTAFKSCFCPSWKK